MAGGCWWKERRATFVFSRKKHSALPIGSKAAFSTLWIYWSFCIAFLPPHKVQDLNLKPPKITHGLNVYEGPLILRINPEGWAHRCHWRLFLLHVFRHPKLEMVRIHLPCNKWRKGDGKRKKKTPTYESWNGERSMIVNVNMIQCVIYWCQDTNKTTNQGKKYASKFRQHLPKRSWDPTSSTSPTAVGHKETFSSIRRHDRWVQCNKSIRNLALKPSCRPYDLWPLVIPCADRFWSSLCHQTGCSTALVRIKTRWKCKELVLRNLDLS